MTTIRRSKMMTMHAARGLFATARTKPFTASPMKILDAGRAGKTVFTTPGTPTLRKNPDGALLRAPNIKPIFWGTEWFAQSPPIPPQTIIAKMNALISGPYLDGLVQYGLTEKPKVLSPYFVAFSEPAKTPTLAQWQQGIVSLLNGLIDDDELAEPDEDWDRLNVVFMPSTFVYPTDSTGTTLGFHSAFQWQDYDLFDVDDDPVRYAAIGTAAYNGISGLDMTTYTFSHELVEAMTDPDLKTGWRQVGAPAGQDELADSPCNHIARLNGIAVASYWSNDDNACIIPGLVHTAYVGPPDIHVDSKVLGPEQTFHVDRNCGRDDHWVGDYTYRIERRQLTINLQAYHANWVNPTSAWRVGGVAVANGTTTVNFAASVTIPGYPSETTSTRMVGLSVTANNDRLTLVSSPADGKYTVPIVYTIQETFNDSNPAANAYTISFDLDIEGQTLVFSDDYIAAFRACMRAQIRGLAGGIKTFEDTLAELLELIRTHRGPPIDEKPDLKGIHSIEVSLQRLRTTLANGGRARSAIQVSRRSRSPR